MAAYYDMPHYRPGSFYTYTQTYPPATIALLAMSFLCWDMILTFGDEVEYIWRGPWSNLKSFYFIVRFVTLFSQLMNVTLTFAQPSKHCPILSSVEILSSIVLMALTHVLMTVRVCSLYRDTRFVYHGIRFLCFVEIAGLIIVYSLTRPDGVICDHEFSSNQVQRFGFAVPPLIFNTILLALTLIKFHRSLRRGWGRVPAVTKFMQDGVWAYALPSTTVALTLCMNYFGGIPYVGSGRACIGAVNGFCGYRLIINTFKMLQTATELDRTEFTSLYISDPNLRTSVEL